MKCFYHKTDLDGHCAGAIVKAKYLDCEMIGVDYGDTIENFLFHKGERIFVVDFCFPSGDMKYLDSFCKLTWIDHHKTAIETMGSDSIAGFREIGKAGCELTWNWIFPDYVMPRAVCLLGRYDVGDWDHPEVMPFQFGMREYPETLPGSKIWDLLLSEEVQVPEIIEKGKIILGYEKRQNEMYARGMSFEANFEGYRAIVINKAYCNSKIFESVYDPKKHDIMVTFGVKPGSIKYTLYAEKNGIDVSEIAKRYGGGGHAKAAGFMSDQFVIRIDVDPERVELVDKSQVG